ncbi:MAG TPA: peptidoglycan DD-metalloendopeptidase family protein [Longimicrobium sp.]|nr:peptidoglycan DD-metalloendopeptidase family protein [Longimicrobium sp.]
MARRPYRILAMGVLFALGAGVGVQRVTARQEGTTPPPLPLMGTLYAAPAEVARADTLRKGETLSELLERTRLDREAAQALLQELAEVTDPRSIRPGLVVQYRMATRDGRIRGMSTRVDADRSLAFRRAAAGWTAQVEEVPVRRDTAVLAGTVRQSLYQALMAADGDVPRGERQAIADVLADKIFAWKIDFSRDLRPGDGFRVLYERMVRPDGTARTSRVLAVQFDIGGATHDAYLFTVDGVEDYYDGEGESLRRAFLRAPLEFRRISSSYSTGRFHPILRRVRAHHGIDYAASHGTPIRAVGDGVVQKAGWGGGYGNVVEIRHQRGYASRYAHMRGFATGVRPGTRVRQGQLIGYVGTTGLSTGPHLHYEFHMNGRPVNPASIRYLTGDPVPGGVRGRFRAQVGARIAAMDRSGPLLAANARRDTAKTTERG